MLTDREPQVEGASAEAAAPTTPQPVAPPQSRFLFVNVAAQRAKQLRRGALPKLPELRSDPASGTAPLNSHRKPERVAVEEVARGLIPYTLPEPPSSRRETTTP